MKHFVPLLPQEPVAAASLLLKVPAIEPTVAMSEVFAIFADNPGLVAVPVTGNGIPIGIINRKKMIESFARPYTRELFGKKPISAFMDAQPLIVDIHMDLDDLSRTIMESGMHYMYEGFIITDGGRYVGMGAGYDLMKTITERTQARLYRLAHYDTLTGLPNRLLFLDRLTQAMAQAHRHQRLVAVLMLDFDRFKAINDTLGHTVGDLLLRTIGERLSGCVREGDTIARLGGDEFVVMLPEMTNVEDAATVAQKILHALSHPFVLDGHEAFITTSIGIAVYPFDDNLDDLLRNADTAMYQAKEHGGNGFQFFTVEMNVANRRRLSLDSALRRALERDELVLHYQPQFDLRSGRIVGAEALIRWHHPELGLIAPAEFIPLAEETGQIVPIGEWTLYAACRQRRAWISEGLPSLRVAVNLSAHQFYQKGFVDVVAAVLDDNDLDPCQLELELTEGVLMQNTRATVGQLQELHAMGVHLSVDDFGTGYSSLSYLKRFPLDTLKIDRSFVCDITTDTDDAAIAQAIIAMAHSLGMKVVAEGVETPAQLRFLEDHGCDLIQGYLLSPPVPADALRPLLAKPGLADTARLEAPTAS